ncbi:hypothetical protein M9H77_02482 [Catharanthus roseus]|uniref:Uncharacterized protein n=1 Tax=Catharanthus roseus TaxID=4058 RepID=A0ACC0C8M5_CATRO|nr:hypothetical protein M9H77_02482 [Catharanthus roseus]
MIFPISTLWKRDQFIFSCELKVLLLSSASKVYKVIQVSKKKRAYPDSYDPLPTAFTPPLTSTSLVATSTPPAVASTPPVMSTPVATVSTSLVNFTLFLQLPYSSSSPISSPSSSTSSTGMSLSPTPSSSTPPHAQGFVDAHQLITPHSRMKGFDETRDMRVPYGLLGRNEHPFVTMT